MDNSKVDDRKVDKFFELCDNTTKEIESTTKEIESITKEIESTTKEIESITKEIEKIIQINENVVLLYKDYKAIFHHLFSKYSNIVEISEGEKQQIILKISKYYKLYEIYANSLHTLEKLIYTDESIKILYESIIPLELSPLILKNSIIPLKDEQPILYLIKFVDQSQ
jgi:DNA repair ATPase RecN